MDKVANDGSTSISCWVDGIFDLTAVLTAGAEGPIVAGYLVAMSGANLIRAATVADVLSGAVVGKALESASAGTPEAILVQVGRLA
jgi:hypothetical protein